MRPKELGDDGQGDLFVSRLDQIVNLQHALVKQSKAIDWGFLKQQLGAVYGDEPGRPRCRCG
jgi:transposase, IS5 family